MLGFLKPKQTINHIERLQNNLVNMTNTVEMHISNIEQKAKEIELSRIKSQSKLKRMKHTFHSLPILVSDKDKDLKIVFANKQYCTNIYGLEDHCTELISGKFEYEIINEYIEKNKKWNSFIECINFNIDELVLETMKSRTFIQRGFVDENQILLKTTLNPYIDEYNNFNGIVTISDFISENVFEKNTIIGKLLYNQNSYTVYEI